MGRSAGEAPVNAIGVFDSGVGGLSVLREIRAAMPAEDLIYLADSGWAPYGDKDEHYVMARAEFAMQRFIELEARAVVIACNTATAVAVDVLRRRYAIPVVAIEPAVKPAVSVTKSGVIAILATTRTLASVRLRRLIARFSHTAKIILQPCPGLAEQVEFGALGGSRTTALVSRYVTPLLQQGADTLVLGCTHYPFLAPVIRAIAGPDVTILDPAPAVAKQLSRRLQESPPCLRRAGMGTEVFLTTGCAASVQDIVQRLWRGSAQVMPLK
ncbi:MAG: glutamate racemase [Rhodospirillaceae bacterium]